MSNDTENCFGSNVDIVGWREMREQMLSQENDQLDWTVNLNHSVGLAKAIMKVLQV